MWLGSNFKDFLSKRFFSWYVFEGLNASTCLQVVYNANNLSKLVDEKKKFQNWLDYYQLKYSRNPSKRPKTKVWHCKLFMFLFLPQFLFRWFSEFPEECLTLYLTTSILCSFATFWFALVRCLLDWHFRPVGRLGWCDWPLYSQSRENFKRGKIPSVKSCRCMPGFLKLCWSPSCMPSVYLAWLPTVWLEFLSLTFFFR